MAGFPKYIGMRVTDCPFPKICHCILTLVVAAPAVGAEVGSEAPTCAESAIVAGSVRTEEDIRVFVQCAYEYARQEGLEEARRAFNQDARWNSGSIYVFISEVTPFPERSGPSFHLSPGSGEGRDLRLGCCSTSSVTTTTRSSTGS